MTCDCGTCAYVWTGGQQMTCMACGRKYDVVVTFEDTDENAVKGGKDDIDYCDLPAMGDYPIVIAHGNDYWYQAG